MIRRQTLFHFRLIATVLAAVAGFLSCLRSGLAQCPTGWLPGGGLPGTNGSVKVLAVLPGGDVLMGGEFTIAGGVAANNIARYSSSTNTWSALGSGVTGTGLVLVNALAVLPDGGVIVGGRFSIAGGVAANSIARYSPAANTWSALGAGTGGRVDALALLPGGDMIAGGDFRVDFSANGHRILRYTAASNSWSPLGTGTNGDVHALAVMQDGDVVVGGYFSSAGGVAGRHNIARYSPSTNTWSALGTGFDADNSRYVNAIAVLPGGELVVAGVFSTAGGVATNNIARYSPAANTWSALGAGTDSEVHALALLPDGNVIAGGRFRTAGGVAANYVARYSPVANTWSALGVRSDNGANRTVRAFAVLPGADVIVGGDFSAAGSVAANNIARYSPATNTWSALGVGTAGSVTALSVLPGGDVVVGGDFFAAGGVLANHIARYSPATNAWSTLGAGVSEFSSVMALAALPGGDVIVGGSFSSAGGMAANKIARYSPSSNTWSALGSGVTGSGLVSVNALAVLPEGDVIVGGSFSSAGGVTANNIASYSPSTNTWSALSSGVTITGFASVNALAVVPSGDVIVGGGFDTAGGIAANRIARYSRSTNVWTALGMGTNNGTNNGVLALAVLPGGDVIAGGSLTIAGGIAANRVARYSSSTNVWTALGMGTNNGTNSFINALVVLPGENVIVGGDFEIAGGNVAAHFARYTFGSTCRADFNCSDGITLQDIFDFLAAWFAGSASGDFNRSGSVTLQDLFDFLAAWFAGCP